MGVTYKLRDEVVHFIISLRQSNPLYSCRQLAESASQKFGLVLSKSSVHDVLKDSGIITPRGRKPKTKFEIPQEKKKQIQESISSAIKVTDTFESKKCPSPLLIQNNAAPVILSEVKPASPEISPEYEGAGKVFLKAVLWDLGIFSTDLPVLQGPDWDYYLTYTRGIKVALENNKVFFIDLPLPIERCIREATDGLINNLKPMVVHKVSDQELFKVCMEAQAGYKIKNIEIVGQNDHILLELSSIVEQQREFIFKNRTFVDNYERNFLERAKTIFFSQTLDNNNVIENILNLKGFDTTDKDTNVINLTLENAYIYKDLLQKAAEKLNGMYLRDEKNRLVGVKIETLTKDA
jgi:hypothetical protein